MSELAGGWEIVCPDGRVRSHPYHNHDDAEAEAQLKTTRQCRIWPKASRLERALPPCTEGTHTVRPIVFDDSPPEVGAA